MRSFKLMSLLLAGVALTTLTALAAPPTSSKQAITARLATRATVTVTNGILTVSVSDNTGQFTVTTGANHPHPGQTVFFPIGTSYFSLRDQTAKIVWDNDDGEGTTGLPGFTSQGLHHVKTEKVSATEIKSTYNTPVAFVAALNTRAEGPTPDWTVIQDLQVNGTTLADTNVRISLLVMNTGMITRNFGVRNMWDYEIANNDGAIFRARQPDGTFTPLAMTFTPPAFNAYEQIDDPTHPTFSVFGSVKNLSLVPPPTPPDQLRFARWPAAVSSSWEFANTGDASSDSAICYYWGLTGNLSLPPGSTQTFTQYVTTELSAIHGGGGPVIKGDPRRWKPGTWHISPPTIGAGWGVGVNHQF